MITKERVCFNCKSVPKYKCPKCRIPYCSVQCYQTHKTTGCLEKTHEEIVEQKPENENVQILHPTEDTLPLDKLEKLRDSPGVRECLKNPHVRHILSAVDKSKNPTDLIAQAMLEPIFEEFASECLKVVQPDDSSHMSSDED